MIAMFSPVPYWTCVVLGAAACAVLCRAARRRPGPWRIVAARVIGLVLLVDAVSYPIGLAMAGTWSASTSLPLELCDMGVLVAAAACWWRTPLLVEVTYFWGLAGTLQAVLTPDLVVPFPGLVFFQYVVGHVVIVSAALFLVVGMGIRPRPGSIRRVYAVTLAYTLFVGAVDSLTGADYMFLRQPPPEWTLLRLLGPWPWYLVSGALVALVLVTLLDLPFWAGRRRDRAALPGSTPAAAPASVPAMRSTADFPRRGVDSGLGRSSS
jgi:hypothetical integral membrane protein (TIGR02206 family)